MLTIRWVADFEGRCSGSGSESEETSHGESSSLPKLVADIEVASVCDRESVFGSHRLPSASWAPNMSSTLRIKAGVSHGVYEAAAMAHLFSVRRSESEAMI